MKRSKILLAAVLSLLTFTAISCSEDDNEYAKEVAGSYDGTLVMSVSGTDYGTFDMVVNVESTSDDQVSMAIPAFGEGHMAMPELTVTNVDVDKDGSTYTLKKDQFTITVNEVPYKGSINGTVKDGKLTFTSPVTPGAMPMAVDLNFTTK
jgi:hypothetical protein